AAAEHEREYFQTKAELEKTRDQLRLAVERYERDLQTLRSGSKEREERLLVDNERLQTELMSLTQRTRSEYEAEIRRIKTDYESDLKKARAQADLSGAALQRMRAVGGALEKQVASLKAQSEEAKKLKEEFRSVNERYKAEFLTLQRKWQEREEELRKQAGAHYEKQLDAERAKIKLRAQEEIQNRLLKTQEALREEMDRELVLREKTFRAKVEGDFAERIQALRSQAQKTELHAEEARSQTEADSQRKAQETESLRRSLDELRGRLAKEEEWKASAGKERAEIEAQREREQSALREKVRRLEEALSESLARLTTEERRFAASSADRDSAHRLRLGHAIKEKQAAKEAEELRAQIARIESEAAALKSEKARAEESVHTASADQEKARRKMDMVR
ncbi:MAG: hypothetical protein AAB578_02145, partial [Elusimicrobiota bacterium]